ncbi:MAG: BamA/OMP85 family outer membrane protein, partial [Planctomycetaceae bacterium]
MTGVSEDTRSPNSAGRTACVWLGTALILAAAATLAALAAGANPWWIRTAAAQPLIGPEDAMRLLDEPLAQVRIEGNTTIPTSAIERFIKTRPGRPADENQVRQDISRLYGTRWFFSVERVYRQGPDGLELVFRVLERPIVQKVEYKGNQKIKTKELAAHTGLKQGSPFDVASNRDAARRIEEIYREKGYTFCTVELEKGGRENDRDVIFLINEGPKVKVSGVSFEGNDFFSDALLRTKLQTKPAILWFIGGKYDPEMVPNDIAALKQYYHSLGFFDVKIEHHEVFNEDKSRVRLEYTVEEGERYKVRNVEIVGTQVLSEAALREALTLEEGEHFNQRHLSTDLNDIKDQYGEMGRIFAQVEAVPRFLSQPGEVDLIYQIDEDKVYHIRRVNVHIAGDNPRTKRTVVLNRVLVRPGDLANRRKIELSESRLGGVQVFDRAPPNGPRINVSRVESENSYGDVRAVRGQNADGGSRGATGRVRISDGPRSPDGIFNEPQSKADWPFEPGGHSTAPPPDWGLMQTSGWRSLDEPSVAQPSRAVSARTVATRPGSANNVRSAEPSQREKWGSDNGIELLSIRAQNYSGPYGTDPNPLYELSPSVNPNDDAFDPYDPPRNEIDLDVFVQEARTGRLMFGVGVNSDAGVVGSIVLTEENFDILRPPRSFADLINGTAFRGAGQRLRIEAVPGNIVSRYLVSWTDPYFLNTDNSLTLSGFYYNRFFEDWDETRGGGRVGVGRQLSPFTSISATARLESVEIDNPDFPTPPILLDALGSHFLSTARLAVAHDTRD